MQERYAILSCFLKDIFTYYMKYHYTLKWIMYGIISFTGKFKFLIIIDRLKC